MREQAQDFLPGMPILITPDWRVDFQLAEFFYGLEFGSFPASTQTTYAIEIKTWCRFLERRGGLHWTEADEEDFAAFKRWRTDSRLNPDAITETTWIKAVAALRRLYQWAGSARRQYVIGSPVPASSGSTRVRPGTSPTRPAAVTSQRIRWITPATFRLWLDVGMRGYDPQPRLEGGFESGLRDPGFRGRNTQRNCAYAQLVYNSALRRQEIGTLLTTELPELDQTDVRLARAVTKGRKVRHWRAFGDGLADTLAYIEQTRAEAVARARTAGRYRDLPNARWVTAVEHHRSKGASFVFSGGSTATVGNLDAAERMQLFTTLRDGRPEPLMVWLREDGMPQQPQGWNKVFETANERVAARFSAIGHAGRTVVLSPHSLRFSYALFVLAALHRALDRKNGWTASDPYDENRYLQAYTIVQDLLGHVDVRTTKETYLQPLQGLRGQALLEEACDDIRTALAALATHDPRVLDITGVPNATN